MLKNYVIIIVVLFVFLYNCSDKIAEQVRRYTCGHKACDVCALGTGYCMFCLTPPKKSTSNNSSIDELSTQRSTNAFVLLEAFQKAFNVDVYKHQKMAEQLKLEKDMFPECIQAPNKYFNKRKSSNTYVKRKENQQSKLPGESVNPVETSRMANSIDSVEQWFNKNKKKAIQEQNFKNENDESGIVIDASFTDCSQISEDKDRQALLAVYEADKNNQGSDSVLSIGSKEWDDNEITAKRPKMFKDEYKIPFFKKSKLAETSQYNNDSNILKISTNMFGQTKNIQIMIFNNNECLKPNELVQRRSTPVPHTISVQTDICDIPPLKGNYVENGNTLEQKSPNLNESSHYLFTDEESHNSNTNLFHIDSKIVTKSVVIQESDSEDESGTEAETIEVSAQIHKFEHSVLSDITYIDSQEEFIERYNERRRRLTPDSSNSSEKENVNPNRKKKPKYGKKFKK